MSGIPVRFAAAALALCLLAGCVPGPSFPGAAAARPSPAQKKLFEDATAAYDAGRYAESESLFEKIISGYPGSPLLVESQWMLGRSYERQGDWERALVQYRSYGVNFPNGPRAEEARLRAEILEGIRRRSDSVARIPPVFGVELAEGELGGDLRFLRSRGVDAVLLNEAAVETLRDPETVSRIRRDGFRVMAVLRFNPVDLFDEGARLGIQERLIGFGAMKMDGVLFDPEPASASDWYRPEILRQVSEAFGVTVDQDVLHEDPGIYWKWAGWKGRQVVRRLREAVEPVRSSRSPFYWGVLYPPEAVTAPSPFLGESGLDLLEAKNGGADYIGIRVGNRDDAPLILQKATDLVGEPQRVAAVIARPDDDGRLAPPGAPGGSVLYLKGGGSSGGGLTKNAP